MRWIAGGVTTAVGFLASGVSAGIKRRRKSDLALVVSDTLASAAGVMTTNRIQAAPVQLSARRLRRGTARAILLNSGCANCLTGPEGVRDALRLGRSVARALGVPEREVLLASTGLIGRRLPVARMERAIPPLIKGLSRDHHRAAAQAILTTDRVPKEAAVQARLGGRLCHVGGMAKGAGMIAPSMATMLCVLTTDVAIAPGLLREALREATNLTFNRISVDGDMSTNDAVLTLANGRSGVAIRRTAEVKLFMAMLMAVSAKLAACIVEDGEGASKVMEVQVVGARTEHEAKRCARQVANSPLVKTMLAGADPNVGRIAAAVGASAARFDPDRLDIFLDHRPVVSKGAALHVGTAMLRSLLAKPRVEVRVDLRAGRARALMVTCDLTEAYVRINAGYSS